MDAWPWENVNPSDKATWPPWWKDDSPRPDKSKDDDFQEAAALRRVIEYHNQLYYLGRKEVPIDDELGDVLYG